MVDKPSQPRVSRRKGAAGKAVGRAAHGPTAARKPKKAAKAKSKAEKRARAENPAGTTGKSAHSGASAPRQPAARRRAAARTLRRTGELVLSPRLAISLAALLFLTGALAGGLIGTSLTEDRMLVANAPEPEPESTTSPPPENATEQRYLSALRPVEMPETPETEVAAIAPRRIEPQPAVMETPLTARAESAPEEDSAPWAAEPTLVTAVAHPASPEPAVALEPALTSPASPALEMPEAVEIDDAAQVVDTPPAEIQVATLAPGTPPSRGDGLLWEPSWARLADPPAVVVPEPPPSTPEVPVVSSETNDSESDLVPATKMLDPGPPSATNAGLPTAHTVYQESFSLAQVLSTIDQSRYRGTRPAPTPTPRPELVAAVIGEPAPEVPVWQANAVQVADVGDRPMIALVIDDLGLNRPNSWRTVELPGPLTLAFLTYAENIGAMLDRARLGGHELMIHVPMEPRDHDKDPGPRVLEVGQDTSEMRRRLAWGLERFEGVVGINNHMGSAFTSWRPGMRAVLAELKRRGLLFLDSKTSERSVVGSIALEMGVPFAERDIFLDNDHNDRGLIRRQLEKLEGVARRRGHAVGIAHPHRATIEVLADWLPKAEERGFALVPISAVVRRRIDWARREAGPG